MELQPFIEDVRARAGLTTREEAIGAAEATLETLGEVLQGGDREDVAHELPEALAAALERSSPGQRLDPDEFYERVTEREKQGRGIAAAHAEAVCSALAQALNSEQRANLRFLVPEDFRYLFEPPETAKSPPGDTGGARASERTAEPEDVGEVTRKGEQVGHPPPNTSTTDLEDTNFSQKATSNQPSPAPEKSPQRDEGRDRPKRD